jgi:hypothetical protein
MRKRERPADNGFKKRATFVKRERERGREKGREGEEWRQEWRQEDKEKGHPKWVGTLSNEKMSVKWRKRQNGQEWKRD